MSDDRVRLHHIQDAIARIESYVSGGKDVFLAETMVQDAVIRNLEVIGEAVKGLSEDVRAEHPEIPWARIAGMRDVLIHEYFGVRLETVWAVVGNRLPELKRHVEALLSDEAKAGP
jgi:uncharacterized protein with HEPN domain